MQEISFLYKIYAYVLEEHEEEISERSANNVYFEIEDVYKRQPLSLHWRAPSRMRICRQKWMRC